MKTNLARIVFLIFLLPVAICGQENLGKEDLAFWKEKAKPVLQKNCWKCHGAEKKIKGDLVLTTRQGVLDGGEIGPAADLEKPDASLLLQMISYKDEHHKMPPKGELSYEELKTLKKWIQLDLPLHP